MKTLILASAASLAIWGGGALAQTATAAAANPAASPAANPAANGDAPVVRASWRGGRKGGRGGRRAMMRILRAADTNNDNALTQAELDAYVESQATAADANGDGDVTLAEFDTIWNDITQRQKVRAFQRLDADGSGAITAAERAELFGGIVSRLDRNDDGKLDRADRRGRRDR